MKHTLFPDQLEAVDGLRANMRKGVHRQVLCAPTGSGKTEIAMYMTEEAMAKGSRVLFVADLEILVDQSSERFWFNEINHGILMSDKSHSTWEQTLVCSAQTLEARPNMLKRILLDSKNLVVFIDECHTIRKKLMQMLVDYNVWVIGLSATPITKGLDKYYDEVVNVTTTTKLIAKTRLTPLTIVAGSQINVDGLTLSSNGEWVKRELSTRVMQVIGDAVPAWEANMEKYFGGPAPTIAFCPTVADSMNTAEAFQKAGHDFQVIHYKQSSDEKKNLIKAFNAGQHIGLISCVALTKGFDAPLTRCIIDMYPLRKALAQEIQRIGRGIRTYGGKEFCLLIDMAGNYLGFYDQIHSFFDEGVNELSSEKHRNVSRQPPEKTDHLKCHECGLVLPPKAKTCPGCGAERKRPRGRLQHVDGDLVEIEKLDGRGRPLPFGGDWWPELCALACQISPDDLDKARKIALAKYKEIFGRWPKAQFVPLDRPPNASVAKYSRAQYQRYLIAKRKAQEKEAAHA